jgi:hypothetical protein
MRELQTNCCGAHRNGPPHAGEGYDGGAFVSSFCRGPRDPRKLPLTTGVFPGDVLLPSDRMRQREINNFPIMARGRAFRGRALRAPPPRLRFNRTRIPGRACRCRINVDFYNVRGLLTFGILYIYIYVLRYAYTCI